METESTQDLYEPEAEPEAATLEPQAGPILTLQERVERLERLHVQYHGALPTE